MRAFSFGGGVQSVAVLALGASGKIQYDSYLFCNVGKDTENPKTLNYFYNVAITFAKQHGLDLIELHRQTNNGETLYQRTLRQERSIKIPMRMKNGAPGHRSCTQDYKRDVVAKHLGKGQHTVGLGISIDEWQRMRTDSGYPNIVNEYPLIDLRLSRADCLKIIREAGLPIPPKSACWFCPFHKPSEWAEQRRNEQNLFWASAELEGVINEKRTALGRDAVYLTRFGVPLAQAIGDQPLLISDEETCESGYCMT